jgi:hypothetical protein
LQASFGDAQTQYLGNGRLLADATAPGARPDGTRGSCRAEKGRPNYSFPSRVRASGAGIDRTVGARSGSACTFSGAGQPLEFVSPIR